MGRGCYWQKLLEEYATLQSFRPSEVVARRAQAMPGGRCPLVAEVLERDDTRPLIGMDV